MAELFESVPKEFVSRAYFYDYKTPVTGTLKKVKELGAVVVLKDREYYGIVDDRSIFRNRSLKPLNFSKNFPIGKFSQKLPVLDSDTSLGRVVNYFHQFSAKALPYQEGKTIKGIVKRDMIVRTILSLHLISKAKVGDVMSTPVIGIDATANIAQAMSTMEKTRISRLVVLDNGKLAGFISLRDIADQFVKPEERLPERRSKPFSPANIPVSSVMKTYVYSIDFSKPVEDGIRQLLEKEISSLVVLRGGRAVGLLSTRDIIEAAAATTAKTQSKIIISGLDEETRDSEDWIRSSLDKLVSKIDKFERLTVDYASINVKRSKSRNYEMKVRLSLQRRGSVFAHATGYSLDNTLAKLLENVYKRIKEKKEIVVSTKKESDRYYGQEE